MTLHDFNLPESITNTLDSIENSIKHDLECDTLSPVPKLATLQLPSSTPVDDTHTGSLRGPADAMNVADYSVYHEQVKC